MNPVIPITEIQKQIHAVRGKRVIGDSDLAAFYGVTTFNLNKAVSRNQDRFPEDFSFRLTAEETRILIFQCGISSSQHGGIRRPMRVFTEQGAAMLASVLRSPRATSVSIAIIRAFVHLHPLTQPRNAGAFRYGERQTSVEKRLFLCRRGTRKRFSNVPSHSPETLTRSATGNRKPPSKRGVSSVVAEPVSVSGISKTDGRRRSLVFVAERVSVS